MVELCRKKITTMGTSNGVVIPAIWLIENHLKMGNEIEMLVDDNYILIKNCSNPFFNDLLPREMQALYELTYARKLAMEDAQRRFEQVLKDLREGKGQSIDDLPPFYDALQADIQREAKAKTHGDKARYKAQVDDAELEQWEKDMHTKIGNERFKRYLAFKKMVDETMSPELKEWFDKLELGLKKANLQKEGKKNGRSNNTKNNKPTAK